MKRYLVLVSFPLFSMTIQKAVQDLILCHPQITQKMGADQGLSEEEKLNRIYSDLMPVSALPSCNNWKEKALQDPKRAYAAIKQKRMFDALKKKIETQATKGCTTSQFLLGAFYESKGDKEKAKALYQQIASKEDYPHALRRLGLLHLFCYLKEWRGPQVPQNQFEYSVKHSGFGGMLINGVEQEKKLKKFWEDFNHVAIFFLKAADQGDIVSQAKLGLLYTLPSDASGNIEAIQCPNYGKGFSYLIRAYVHAPHQKIKEKLSEIITMYKPINTHQSLTKNEREKIHYEINSFFNPFKKFDNWYERAHQNKTGSILTLKHVFKPLWEVKQEIDAFLKEISNLPKGTFFFSSDNVELLKPLKDEPNYFQRWLVPLNEGFVVEFFEIGCNLDQKNWKNLKVGNRFVVIGDNCIKRIKDFIMLMKYSLNDYENVTRLQTKWLINGIMRINDKDYEYGQIRHSINDYPYGDTLVPIRKIQENEYDIVLHTIRQMPQKERCIEVLEKSLENIKNINSLLAYSFMKEAERNYKRFYENHPELFKNRHVSS